MTVPAAMLLAALAGVVAAMALVTVVEILHAAVSIRLHPLLGHIGASFDRALQPLRLAGAHGVLPTDKERLRFSVAVAAVGAVLGFAAAGLLASFGAAAAFGWLASRAFAWRRERYRRQIDGGAPSAALALADALDAGQSVRSALSDVADGLPAPVGTELGRVAQELALGVETEEALGRLRLRAGSRRINLIIAAVRIQRRAGGSLATLLREIAATIQEQDRHEHEAHAASAQARFTSVIVLCLPVFGLLLAELAAPGIVGRIAGSSIGAWLLGTALLLQLTGLLLIRRLSRIDA